MSGIRYPLIITGVPVAAPAGIDLTTAGQRRMVLLEAGRRGHATVAVDLTSIRILTVTGLDRPGLGARRRDPVIASALVYGPEQPCGSARRPG